MRVSAETRESTRQRILDVANELFRTAGFNATTTRDIAKAAGIATGTLFNYFQTKEAIVMSMVLDFQAQIERRVSGQHYDTLEEALFAYVSAGLRVLKPLRNSLGPILDTTLSPLTASVQDDSSQNFRVAHLERVVEFGRQHKLDAALTPVVLQLYWTLYLGVLAFWTNDRSPKQEDTLALLDQSLDMFVGWLKSGGKK